MVKFPIHKVHDVIFSMKDLKKETAKMLAGASKNIAQLVASSSFGLWQWKEFWLYVDFDNIGQTEQDRMFSELEVSVLGLFILHLDHATASAKEESKFVFDALRKDLPSGFIQLLIDHGIEKSLPINSGYLLTCVLKNIQKILKQH